MNELGFIIQARSNSSRLPNKAHLRFIDESTMLDVLIRKIKNSFQTQKIILATSDLERDDAIEAIATRHGIDVYRGSENNVLSRFVEAAIEFGVDKIIRVCGDNPMIEIRFILDLINQWIDEDYISFAFEDSTPTIRSHMGVFIEGVKLNALMEIQSCTEDPHFLEHVTNFIYSYPTRFSIRWLDLPAFLKSRMDIRMTVDTMEDLELLQLIFSKMDHNSPLEEIIKYIDQNPILLGKMRKIIQQNEK